MVARVLLGTAAAAAAAGSGVLPARPVPNVGAYRLSPSAVVAV